MVTRGVLRFTIHGNIAHSRFKTDCTWDFDLTKSKGFNLSHQVSTVEEFYHLDILVSVKSTLVLPCEWVDDYCN